MATLTKNFNSGSTSQSYVSTRTNTLSIVQRYNQLIKDLEFSHFGLISITILFGSCLGGIAAMFVFMAGAPIWVFGIGLAASLANLVAAISQAPTKWVMNLFILSVLVNLALIAIYLF